jgi:hypothetical protein
MEIRLLARYKGWEPDYVIFPDGTVTSGSFKELAEKIRAYREGR